MPKSKLSASEVASLTCEKGKVQTDFFDTELHGFGVRVSAKKKVYFVQCKVKGQFNTSGKPLELKHTLGTVTDRLDETGRRRADTDQFKAMYDKARKIIDDAKDNGKTPKDRDIEKHEKDEAERKEIERLRKIEEAKDVTLRDLFKIYITAKQSKGKLKESTAGQYKLSLETHCADWIDLPARNITKTMIEERHAEIAKKKAVIVKAGEKIRGGNNRVRGGMGTADATMRAMRAILNRGVKKDEIGALTFNPADTLAGEWYNLGRRDISIASDQLRTWFEGIEAITNPAIKLITQISLFTGARKNEVQSLSWADVDLDAECPYAIFRETKNGKQLLIPLAAHVVKLMQDYRAVAFSGPEGFIFPSYGKTGHIKETRKQIKKAVEASDIGKYIPHAARSTFLSFCNHDELQVQQWTQKRLCNHALPQDVTQGYVQYELKSLALTVERIAAFILRHAGMTVPPPVEVNTEDQSELPQQAEPKQATDNVISLDEHRAAKAA